MADDLDMSVLDSGPVAQSTDPVRLVLDSLAAIGTVWTFGLMLLICADVIGRSFLNYPITGVAEIAANSVVGIVFLQIGAAIHARRMTRADFLIDRIMRKSPKLGVLIEALFFLVGVVVMLLIAYSSWGPMWTSLAQKEFFGVQGLFTFPTWPFRALIVLGSVAGALAYIVLFFHEIGRLRSDVRG